MTKATFKSSISPSSPSAPAASATPAASSEGEQINAKSQKVAGDTYSSTGKNKYKAMMGGSQSQRYNAAINAILHGMMAGLDNPDKPSVADFEEVVVPDAGELLSLPGVRDDVDGTLAIVEKYVGLEEFIEGLIGNVADQLENRNSMSGAEMRSLQDYQKLLDAKLLNCRQQLSEARECHREAVAKDEEARAKLVEEVPWWEMEEEEE